MATPVDVTTINNFDRLDSVVKRTQVGRKRSKNPSASKREVAKKLRHSGQGKEPSIQCTHEAGGENNKKGYCQARTLTAECLRRNWEAFYEEPTRSAQDAIILGLINVNRVQRERVAVQERQRPRSLAIKYNLRRSSVDDGVLVPVCKTAFLSALGLKKDRVLAVAQHWYDNGTPRKETRGGSRETEESRQLKEDIRCHIETFLCRASHYGRKDAPGRKYLPSDLNVARMHNMFQEQNHRQISYGLYRSVFLTDFNLGFGHPATDKCATCESFKLKIRNKDLEQEAKMAMVADFLIHRRKARQFYNNLNDVSDDSVTLCFDMMENQVLPKTPIGSAYYARQFYLYIFAVVQHRGETQAKEDIFFYTCLESENRKDSNMIASSLHHSLQYRKADISSKRSLRLFSDSCYGQNKNFNVLSMLMSDRKKLFPNTDVNYFFPVRGHSFLPADRAFGRVEQSLRKKETILLPEDYIEILEEHGTVFQYQRGWNSLDFKKETVKFIKQKKEFSIANAKRIQLSGSGSGVSVSESYNGEMNHCSLLKPGKSWAAFNPPALPSVSTVKVAKQNDVRRLLDEMGVSEKTKATYESFLTGPVVSDDESE